MRQRDRARDPADLELRAGGRDADQVEQAALRLPHDIGRRVVEAEVADELKSFASHHRWFCSISRTVGFLPPLLAPSRHRAGMAVGKTSSTAKDLDTAAIGAGRLSK